MNTYALQIYNWNFIWNHPKWKTSLRNLVHMLSGRKSERIILLHTNVCTTRTLNIFYLYWKSKSTSLFRWQTQEEPLSQDKPPREISKRGTSTQRTSHRMSVPRESPGWRGAGLQATDFKFLSKWLFSTFLSCKISTGKNK